MYPTDLIGAGKVARSSGRNAIVHTATRRCDPWHISEQCQRPEERQPRRDRPRGVKPGHSAAYRITLRHTQPHHGRAYPVKNVRVVSTHAGHRLGHWRVRTLPQGRSRTLRLKLNIPARAHGSYCITTRAAARHTRAVAIRHCITVETAPPQGRG